MTPCPLFSIRLCSFKLLYSSILFLLCILLLCFEVTASTQIAHAVVQTVNQQYDEFWQQGTQHDFKNWKLNGVAMHGSEQHVDLGLNPSQHMTCNAVDIDGGTASYDATAKLCAGKDPQAPSSYDNGLNYYNGGTFYYG